MEPWLNTFKKDSLEKFQKLPSENSELFKYQTGFKDFEITNDRTDMTDETGFQISHSCEPVQINPISKRDLKVTIKDFDIDDKFVQMNNVFFDRGVIIEALADMDVGTIRIKSSPVKNTFNKIIVIAQDDSKINIVKESSSSNKEKITVSEDVLIVAMPGSKVTFSEIQNLDNKCVHFSNKIAHLNKDARVSWNVGNFGGSMSRTRTYNFLEGNGSHVEDLQATFGNEEQKFDAFSNLVHVGKSTTAKSLSKGVFDNRSASIFKGMIKIKENAKNAGSYLACHGMLLSKDAKANAVPSLEIDTNDVKATHAASVSPIEEEKIFYLVSRGIPKEEAKKMITMGFFDPLIKNIESEEIRAKIRYLIEMKWQGKSVEAFGKDVLKEYMTEDAIKSGDIFDGHYKYRK